MSHENIRSIKPDPETEKQIRHYYLEEKMGLEKAANQLGHTSVWLISRLKGAGIPFRTASEAHTKYSVDEAYFDKIDSHAKATVLGFIYADGCVHRSKDTGVLRLQIAIQHRDIEYLEFIKRELRFTGPISTYKAKNNRYYSRLFVGSDRLCEALIRLGCHERKSLTTKFPTPEQVPDEFLSSFICGFFDGDGGYGVTPKVYVNGLSVNFAISYDMALVFKDFLKSRLRVNCRMSKEPRDKGKESRTHIWRLAIGGNVQALTLCDWMYSQAMFKLSRKYAQYTATRQHYDENLKWIKPEHWAEDWAEKTRRNTTGVKRSEESKARMRASSQNGGRRKRWLSLSIKSPTGTTYHTNCVFKLYKDVLKQLDLHNTHLSRLRKGECAAYKGYTLATPEEIAAARENGTLIEKLY